jgi:hypothetical protein
MRSNIRRLVLFGLVVALFVALMITDRVRQHDAPVIVPPSSPAPWPTGTPVPSSSPTSKGVAPTVRPTPVETGDPHGEHHRPDSAPVLAVAGPYLRLFFDKHVTPSQWRGGLLKLSTASHAATLAAVPRSEVPAVTVGRITVIRLASSAATVRATLSDRSLLDVGLVLDTDGWKVSRVVPYTPVVTR